VNRESSDEETARAGAPPSNEAIHAIAAGRSACAERESLASPRSPLSRTIERDSSRERRKNARLADRLSFPRKTMFGARGKKATRGADDEHDETSM